VPADEQLLATHVRLYRGRVVTFGSLAADVHMVDAERRGDTTHVLVDAFLQRAALDFNFTGGHYLEDAVAALAAFTELGYRLDQARPGAARVVFSELRGVVSPLSGGGLLLNDAYNANPVAVKAAVDHLVSIADGRPPVAVLGDMYELGDGSDAYHRAVGEHCAAAGVRLVAVGGLARAYLTGAADERWFATVEECIAALPELIPEGSAVLVKASRLLRLERVAAALLEDDARQEDAAQGTANPTDDTSPEDAAPEDATAADAAPSEGADA
jgi:UDP-N-acetylmuramoyl-tripeptide--D-alanyl-D-alanine ligase